MDYGVHWLDLAEFVTGRRIVADHRAALDPPGTAGLARRAGRGPGLTGEALPMAASPSSSRSRTRPTCCSASRAVPLVRSPSPPSSPGHPNHIALSVDGDLAGFDWQQEQPNICLERRPDGVTRPAARSRCDGRGRPLDGMHAGGPSRGLSRRLPQRDRRVLARHAGRGGRAIRASPTACAGWNWSSRRWRARRTEGNRA